MKRVKFSRRRPWILIGEEERRVDGNEVFVETWAMDVGRRATDIEPGGRTGVLVARDIVGRSCSTSLVFVEGMSVTDFMNTGWESVCEEGDPDCDSSLCKVHGHE